MLSQSQDADWAAKWSSIFLNAKTLSEATKILRESCGVKAETETDGLAVVPATPNNGTGTVEGEANTVTSQVSRMMNAARSPSKAKRTGAQQQDDEEDPDEEDAHRCMLHCYSLLDSSCYSGC